MTKDKLDRIEADFIRMIDNDGASAHYCQTKAREFLAMVKVERQVKSETIEALGKALNAQTGKPFKSTEDACKAMKR